MKTPFRSLVLLIFFLLIKGTFFAQDFEVSPVILNFNAEPGQTQSIPISIINHSNERAAFTIQLGDFIINKEGQKVHMAPSSTEHSLVNWMSINPPFVEINPNATKQVIVSIQAPIGDYTTRWANIFIRYATEQTATLADKKLQTGLVVTSQIVAQAFQSPKSNVNYKMKISNLTEISMPTDSIRSFTALVDNLGDKITTCKVSVLASNLETAQEVKVNEISFKSFPDSQLLINLKLPGGVLSQGKYQLAAILDYGKNNNLEGVQMEIEVK